MIGLGILLLVVVIGLWIAIEANASRQRRELERLEERITGLEREMGRRGAMLQAVTPPREPGAPPLPDPVPFAPAAPAGELPASGLPAPPPLPPLPGEGAAVEPGGGRTALEQLVGGIWLQNLGSVLVLLGVFFLILWGYTTGRFGPGVLVAAGVMLGIGVAWRGQRMRLRVPAFGHALIGLGLGIVYVTLFLGHVTLHVLGPRAALALLALTALATLLAGLRYRVQTVAALGVLGAFVPPLLARGLSLPGLTLSMPALLAYMAAADLAVWLLAARAGWAALNLVALALTTTTWISSFPDARWGWSIQIALSALLALFGLAPLPALAASGREVSPAERAVLVLAPAAFLVASWPFLAYVAASRAAILLFAMAVAYVAAALWTEPRRDDEVLWRPLLAAATVFLTAALQRAAGHEVTALAWCAEGVALVWIGSGSRGGWLRVCGYGVAALGAIWLLGAILANQGWSADRIPVLYPAGLRHLASLALLISLAALLGSRAPRLSAGERTLGRAVTAGVNLLVMAWASAEASHLASALLAPGGRWSAPHVVGEPPRARGIRTLTWAISSAAWTLQAATLTALGWWRDSAYLRWMGLALFGITVLKFLSVDLQFTDPFWRFLIAVAVGVILLAVSYAYQRRARAAGRPAELP